MEWLLLIILGIIIGCIATIGGFGGGVFFVPFLYLIMSIPMTEAREVSFFVILVNSAIASVFYIKQGRINIKFGLIAAGCTMVGSWTFKIFFSWLEDETVRLIFGWFLAIMSVYFIIQFVIFIQKRRKQQDKVNGSKNEIGEMPELKSTSQLLKTIPIFLLSGFISALTGTGGGSINVPAINLLLDFPIHFATATSTFIIFFTSAFNVIYGIIQGKIELYLTIGIFVAIGGILGSRLGAQFSEKIPKHVLKGIFGAILLYVGLNMIFGG
ncbi:MAG: sulfite exporter TauE/SafE family protein [Promethearchaeota archaeon]